MALALPIIGERAGRLRIGAALVGLVGVGLLVLRSPGQVTPSAWSAPSARSLVSALGFVLIKRWPAAGRHAHPRLLAARRRRPGRCCRSACSSRAPRRRSTCRPRSASPGSRWSAPASRTLLVPRPARRMPAGAVSLIGLVNPVVGTALGVAFAGEAVRLGRRRSAWCSSSAACSPGSPARSPWCDGRCGPGRRPCTGAPVRETCEAGADSRDEQLSAARHRAGGVRALRRQLRRLRRGHPGPRPAGPRPRRRRRPRGPDRRAARHRPADDQPARRRPGRPDRRTPDAGRLRGRRRRRDGCTPPSPAPCSGSALAVVFSGATWTGFLLARQGYMIEAVPPSHRARALSALGAHAPRRADDRAADRCRPDRTWRASARSSCSAPRCPPLGAAGPGDARPRPSSRREQAAAATSACSRCCSATAAPCSPSASPSIVIAASRSIRNSLLPLWADHIGLSPRARLAALRGRRRGRHRFLLPRRLADGPLRAVRGRRTRRRDRRRRLPVLPLATTAVGRRRRDGADRRRQRARLRHRDDDRRGHRPGRRPRAVPRRLATVRRHRRPSGPLAFSALAAVLPLAAACVVVGLVGLRERAGWVTGPGSSTYTA